MSRRWRSWSSDTLSFTLWWADTTDADPVHNAIRVRVHAELNADYACFSFYMDIGQAWNEAHSAHSMRGARRSRLLQAAAGDPRRSARLSSSPCAAGRPAAVDLPAVPENLQSADGRTPDELDRGTA